MTSSEHPSRIIVVDTNVWLDYFLGESPHHKASFAFIVEARERDLPLVIPSHSLKDLFLILQQRIKAAALNDDEQEPSHVSECARVTAWSAVDLVMQLAAVGPSGQSDAWLASKQRVLNNDYEDNLVVACATRLDARMLVTNDKYLIQHSPVCTLTAADALTLIME